MITVAKLRINFGLTGSRVRDSHATGSSHISSSGGVSTIDGRWMDHNTAIMSSSLKTEFV